MDIPDPYRPINRTGPQTLISTPAALFAASSALSGRQRLCVRNESTHTRIRVGHQQANLQRDGEPIEPGDEITIYPAPGLAIYGCSEGTPAKTRIQES